MAKPRTTPPIIVVHPDGDITDASGWIYTHEEMTSFLATIKQFYKRLTPADIELHNLKADANWDGGMGPGVRHG